MDPWVIWLIAAVIFAVGEIATLGFFLAPFAGGALVAALVSAVGGGALISLLVFLLVSGVLLGRAAPARALAQADAARSCARARRRWSAARRW